MFSHYAQPADKSKSGNVAKSGACSEPVLKTNEARATTRAPGTESVAITAGLDTTYTEPGSPGKSETM